MMAALLFAGHAAAAAVHVLAEGGLRVEIEIATDRLAEEFGPRFDRTAVVRSVTLDGVELLGRWGLCDEFGLYGTGVLGYEAAGIDETFLKIGVGRLVRDTAESYRFSHPYPVDTLFPVEVTTGEGSLAVSQRSHGGAWQYRYRKSYQLVGEDRLVIHYELSNTGAAEWTFEHYNHHWFRRAGVPVGPGYRVVTGFELPAAETGFHRAPSSLELPATLADGAAEYHASELAEVEESSNTFEWQVAGAPVIGYQGDFRPVRFALYAHADGFCPEVFMRAGLAPGATATWSASYRFIAP